METLTEQQKINWLREKYESSLARSAYASFQAFCEAVQHELLALAGGIDVARRALHPRCPLALGVWRYPMRLPAGQPRISTARPGDSTVSRSRERLADASAVQFTRQTSGLAGALNKIGGLHDGARQ